MGAHAHTPTHPHTHAQPQSTSPTAATPRQARLPNCLEPPPVGPQRLCVCVRPCEGRGRGVGFNDGAGRVSLSHPWAYLNERRPPRAPNCGGSGRSFPLCGLMGVARINMMYVLHFVQNCSHLPWCEGAVQPRRGSKPPWLPSGNVMGWVFRIRLC